MHALKITSIICSFRCFLFFLLICVHSEIYCRGDLLHTVQMAKLFNDSKTFVDMKMKEPPQAIMDSFRDFMSKHGDKPSKDEIRQFVNVSQCEQIRESMRADEVIGVQLTFFRIILSSPELNLWIGCQAIGRKIHGFSRTSRIPIIVLGHTI